MRCYDTWVTQHFHIIDLWCVMCIHSYAAIQHNKHNSRYSNQILFNDKDHEVLIVSCAPGLKSDIYDCLVLGRLTPISLTINRSVSSKRLVNNN